MTQPTQPKALGPIESLEGPDHDGGVVSFTPSKDGFVLAQVDVTGGPPDTLEPAVVIAQNIAFRAGYALTIPVRANEEVQLDWDGIVADRKIRWYFMPIA